MKSLEKDKVYNKKTLEKELGISVDIQVCRYDACLNDDYVFQVHDFETCCGVKELGGYDGYEHVEVSKKAMKEWMKNGAEEGTSYIATATEGSEFQEVLEHFTAWKKAESFVNSRSDNEVSIYIFVK